MSRHNRNTRNNNLYVSSTTKDGIKKLAVKAQRGRGGKRSKRVSILYVKLLSELGRLREAGVRFNAPLLRQLAFDVIENGTNPDCNDGTVDEHSGLNIKVQIKPM